jgi:hypothetical protein
MDNIPTPVSSLLYPDANLILPSHGANHFRTEVLTTDNNVCTDEVLLLRRAIRGGIMIISGVVKMLLNLRLSYHILK